MQASQPGKGYDLPHDGRLDGSVFRGILGQGQMASILVVPGGELSKEAMGMPFVQHDGVVETLSAQGADQPFAIGVHQRCLNGCLDLADAQALGSPREFESVGSIAIAEQKLRSGIPRESVDHLLTEPLGRRIRGHVRENEPASLEAQDHEDIQDLAPNRRNGEQVNGDDTFGLVAEEGGPGLRSWPRGLGADAGKISRDGTLGDFEAELPEFGVNARGTPSRIRASHLADETSDFGANAGPATSGFPSPEEPKGPMVPLDDGLGLNDDQASPPAAPSVEDESP